MIALDLETTGLDPHKDRVRLIQTYDGTNTNIVDVFEHPEALDDLVELFEDKKQLKIGHNLAFDMSFARAYAGRRMRFENLFDTMVAEQILTAGWSTPYYDAKSGEMKKRMPEYNLKAIAAKHLGIKLDKGMQRSNWGSKELTKEQMAYAAKDVEVLLPIHEIQRELLETNNLISTAVLEFKTLAPVVEIQYIGMPVDWGEAEKLREIKRAELDAAMVDLKKEIISNQPSRQMTLFGATAGMDINLNSPAQVLKYLRDKLGFKDIESSDVESLKSLDHPFAEKLLKFRTLEKHLNFIDQFEEFGAKSGRIYPSYNQCRAATGRMSSSKPNGQQIPKRGAGVVFRKLFKALPGKKLVKVDYSAIEMRVMARLAQDNAMVEAITNGVDLHKLTAAKTSNKAMVDVTKDDRQKAKAVNFGLIYGMSAPTLKKYAWLNYNVRMTDDEALQTRDRYFDLYRGIAAWHAEQKEKMYAMGPYHQHTADKDFYINYVAIQQTISGRKRFWPNYAGETIAKPTEFFNSADQGTSADITKAAMVKLYELLPEDVYIIGAIHDEIICEAPEEKAQEIADLMTKAMVDVGSEILYPVKVDAEAEIAQSWGG
jgi:DNA polymerase-1